MSRLACSRAVWRTFPGQGALLLLGSLLVTGNADAVDFGELFRTPQQRAAARLDAGEYDALIADAPDARWEGLGRYRKGDHSGAAEAFARAREVQETRTSRSANDRNDSLFDQATAATRAGLPGDALPLFDEIIASDPQHADALHNREIARQLQALDAARNQQPDNNQRDTEGDSQGEQQGDSSAEAGDAESGSRSGAEQDASSDGQSSPPEEQDSSATGSDESTDEAGDSNDGEQAGDQNVDDANADPVGIDESEQQAAREALAAEAEARGEGGDDADDAVASAGIDEVPTPSEDQQAAEQWLRRIADDPTGLLRRRLEQSHRKDYPEVRNSDEPW